MQHSWSYAVDEHGYEWAQTNVTLDGSKRPPKLHHLVMGQPLNGFCIDHINGDTLDNRRINLRPCTQEQNRWNQTKVRGDIPYKGVYRNGKRYRAALTHRKRRINIGTYDTPEDAAYHYNEVALELRGSLPH